MTEEPQFLTSVPTKQRDLPTLEEALKEILANGPRPLTIAEYREINANAPISPNFKKITKITTDKASRQRYKERPENI